ncbi:dienelactone hydrolase family protein [Candidatus Igneacidithiobacillus taiwanensis]|uniref:dienelactone hydrolase family protein n=1 Tax=Candidatus Igneacidithiobacillus taiwanensis TaxID=1945924 RepID=UPI0028A00FCB|nr:dienelactone hydrolase family protein [Candidatus Igneacidithiobacillus taiwanensis]MCE5361419.1 dienelactone hydrolase family protein [Acidithiobacillus sp.]
MTSIQSEWLQVRPDLRAYYSRPTGNGPFPLVLVFIEAFGINEHFKDVAQRLAAEGYAAIIPDIYHGKVYAYSDFENAIAHLRTLQDTVVMDEARETIAAVRNRPEVVKGKFGVVGFCMGGRYTFLANAALAADVACAVAFYGGGIAPESDPAGRPPLLDHVPAMQAPLTLFYGSEDNSITPAEHARIVTALSTAGKRYTLSVFPGAPHGFFSDRRDSYRPEAAAEAWQMTLREFAQHLRSEQ